MPMIEPRFFVAAAVSAIVLGATAASAAPVKHPAHPAAHPATEAAHEIGNAGAWGAYVFQNKTGKVCYVVGTPQTSEPARAHRKPPSATVTHRTADKAYNVVSFAEGYTLKPGSDVDLTIDGHKFDLFTDGDAAWSRTSDTDRTITDALAKGRQAIVKAIPARGRPTTDTYSLTGFTDVLKLIDTACGVKR
jgi:invasion protein IalB